MFNEVTTGASSDIKQANDLARRMVTDWGMSEKLGMRTFGDKQELIFLGREISEQKDYSERFALEIDKEINRILDEAHTTAKNILSANRAKLNQIAERLLQKETLEGDELDALFNESVTGGTKPEAPVSMTPPAVSPAKPGDDQSRVSAKKDIPFSPPAEAPGTA